MKRSVLFFLFVAIIGMSSCSKDDNDGVLIPDTPRTIVPDELVGQWLNGTFAMSNWWTYDGQYAGNPYSSSRAFTFQKDGHGEFFQVLKSYNGNCATEAFTYFKGTVQFNDNNQSFIFYPQQGNFRGFYSCASGSNFNRLARKDELKPITLYWDIETDENNQSWMVTKFGPNDPDTEATYFKPTNW